MSHHPQVNMQVQINSGRVLLVTFSKQIIDRSRNFVYYALKRVVIHCAEAAKETLFVVCGR